VQSWLILAASIVCNAAGNLLIRRFAAGDAAFGLRGYLSPWFALGLAAFGMGVLLYGQALRHIPIVLAYPIQVGACVLIIAIFAVGMFGEKLGLTDLLGIALILSGIGLLGRMAA